MATNHEVKKKRTENVVREEYVRTVITHKWLFDNTPTRGMRLDH